VEGAPPVELPQWSCKQFEHQFLLGFQGLLFNSLQSQPAVLHLLLILLDLQYTTGRFPFDVDFLCVEGCS
jgi:hypothetical protein